MSGLDTFVFGLFGLAVVLVVLGVKKVPQGMEDTVERFGRYTRSLLPCFNFFLAV